MRESIYKFILEYIKENFSTDVCDQYFHEEYYKRFGGKRKLTNWGAQPVYKAQRQLKELWEEGILNRSTYGLVERDSGFPKWVYEYYLKEK